MKRFLVYLLASLLFTMPHPHAADVSDTPPDPYLWLEDVTGDKPLEWVRERNA